MVQRRNNKRKNLENILKCIKSTVYQNLWDTAKAIPKRKFKVLNAYIRKEETFKIHDLSFHLKIWQRKKSEIYLRKKVKTEISAIQNKIIEKINENEIYLKKITLINL